jgi:hypothetical protein
MGGLGCLVAAGVWTGLTPSGWLREARCPPQGWFDHLWLGQLGRAAILAPKSVKFFKLLLSNALPLKGVSRVGEIVNLQLTECVEGVP